MLIVHSDHFGITNMDAVSAIRVEGRYIRAYEMCGERHHVIAAYNTRERAEAVLHDFIEECKLSREDSVIVLPEV